MGQRGGCRPRVSGGGFRVKRMRGGWRRLLLACGLLLAVPLAARAQAPEARTWRLAVLASTTVSLEVTRASMLPELARLGFVEGRNLAVSMRHGPVAEQAALVREALRENPDVIFTTGNDITHAVQSQTRSVPVIFFGTDPIGQGFAESLARPGGNVTGVSILAGELDGKRLDMLHQALPNRRRIAALMYAPSADRQASERDLRRAAAPLGLEVRLFDVTTLEELPAAFRAMREARAEALLVMAAPQFFGIARRLAELAREAGLPTICEWPLMASAGCLLGFGPDIDDMTRRAASMAARILRGVPPGDIPIEQPTRFALGVNLATAHALGLTLPPAVMAQADEVFD